MFSITRTRVLLGAGAMLLAGLGLGCQHTHQNKCSTCEAKAVTTPCACVSKKSEGKAPTSSCACAPQKSDSKATMAMTSSAGKATAMPVTPAPVAPVAPAAPVVNPLPPVSNERFVLPERPKFMLPEPPATQAAATSEKAKVDLVPPTPAAKNEPSAVVLPSIGHESLAPRRSFADITAKPEFGHASDYSWLTGELAYIPQKDQWRLRFASIDEEDQYGGSVTLDAHAEMQGYQSGQLVRVEGTVIDKDSREVAPKYRLKEITPLRK